MTETSTAGDPTAPASSGTSCLLVRSLDGLPGCPKERKPWRSRRGSPIAARSFPPDPSTVVGIILRADAAGIQTTLQPPPRAAVGARAGDPPASSAGVLWPSAGSTADTMQGSSPLQQAG